ncbi:DUF2752 domain-containing protein [Nonomuraea sp. NEAU-A123]|uniref:DUF2752 domain-containing protein n=1 Tax=Nonomuraea sp. NEAU-A123 TaxID=2839649 RepID=UPI001BE465FE|nr:DUF2752 domain-containing protein [Nonomuraea sp. NEAU-A123]MBT2228700.1 DUF2752 domain-containing protein [Nonomuraea sp. NEAU-A123]
MGIANIEWRGTDRLRSVLAPLGVAAAAGAVFAVVGTINPNEPGHYPTCPFLWATGLYCPGCGTLRTIHALAHLDPVAALGLNPLAMAMIPFLLFWWGRWLVRAWQGKPRRTTLAHPAWLWAFLGIVLVYWVVRNLPFGAFLAP